MKKGIIHKVLVIAVAATFALSTFAGCTNSNKAAGSSVPAVATEQKALTVSVTLSKEFISGLNSLSNSLGSSSLSSSSSTLPDGVIKITKNKDGSETMVMTKAKYNEMMKGMKDSLNASIKQLTSSSSSTGVKSFKSITANDKMDDFKVIVDKESYTNSLDALSLLGLYMASGLYQEFNNVSNPKVTFHIIDSKDSKEFKTLKYPDDMKTTSNSSSGIAVPSNTKQTTAPSTSMSSKVDYDHQERLRSEGWDSAKKAGHTDGYKDGYQDMLDGSATNTTLGPNYLHSYSVPDGEEQAYYDGYAKGYDYWYHDSYAEGMDQASIDTLPKRGDEEAPSFDPSDQNKAESIDVDGASTPSDSILNSEPVSENP